MLLLLLLLLGSHWRESLEALPFSITPSLQVFPLKSREESRERGKSQEQNPLPCTQAPSPSLTLSLSLSLATGCRDAADRSAAVSLLEPADQATRR